MARRGRPRKSLAEHVAAGTFRAREHARDLVTAELLDDVELQALQLRYRHASECPEVPCPLCGADVDFVRRNAAREFERAVRARSR